MDEEIKKAIFEIRDLLREHLAILKEQRIEQKRMTQEFDSRKKDTEHTMSKIVSMLGNPMGNMNKMMGGSFNPHKGGK